MATRKQLLDDVIRTHKNANKKASRLRAKGVDVTGSKIDPRKNLSDVRQMSMKELRAYRQDLGAFNSRDTQYIGGVHGKALTAAKFNEYKRLEAQYNKNLESRISEIGDVIIPGNQMTIAERYRKMVPKGRGIGGGTSRFYPYNRTSSGFPSDRSLDLAIEDMQKRLVPNFIAEQDRKIRENFMNLMKYSDRPDVLEAAESLSPEQFEILWNFDNLVSNVVENYQMMLDMLSTQDSALDREAVNDIYDDILEKMTEVQRQRLFMDSEMTLEENTVKRKQKLKRSLNSKSSKSTLAKVERAQQREQDMRVLGLYETGARKWDSAGYALKAKYTPTSSQVSKASKGVNARRKKNGFGK